MKKNSKKALATTMCTVMMLGAVAPIVSAKAEVAPASIASSSSFFSYDPIVENIDLGNFIKDSGFSIDGNTASGTMTIDTDTEAIFGSMYQKFIDLGYNDKQEVRGKIMFSKDKSFPSFTYEINVPNGVKIDASKVNIVENTFAIGNIEEKKFENNKLTIKIQLGNWNDYGTFFDKYKSDLDKGIKDVKISIPYTIENYSPDNSYQVNSDGSCHLYYYLFGFIENEIVTLTMNANPLELTPLNN